MAISLSDTNSYTYTAIIQGYGTSKDQDQGSQYVVDTTDDKEDSGESASSSSATVASSTTSSQQYQDIFYQKVKMPGDDEIKVSSYESAYEELQSTKNLNENNSKAIQAYNDVMGMQRRTEIESMFGLSLYA